MDPTMNPKVFSKKKTHAFNSLVCYWLNFISRFIIVKWFFNMHPHVTSKYSGHRDFLEKMGILDPEPHLLMQPKWIFEVCSCLFMSQLNRAIGTVCHVNWWLNRLTCIQDWVVVYTTTMTLVQGFRQMLVYSSMAGICAC